MRELLDNDENDSGSNAASLTQIKVRKPKEPERATPPQVKSGDITERLAALAKDLDRFDETAPADQRERPFVPPSQATRSTGWKPGSPDRRRASTERATSAAEGWGRKPAQPDILNYWLDIRGGSRRYPSWEALEPSVIGKNWPNCILVHCNRNVGRLQVKYDFTHAIRKAAYGETPEEEILGRIEFTPMIVDWILSVGQSVASSRKPAHATEFFPTITGEVPLRVIALPLSESGHEIDHVLCYIQKLQ